MPGSVRAGTAPAGRVRRLVSGGEQYPPAALKLDGCGALFLPRLRSNRIDGCMRGLGSIETADPEPLVYARANFRSCLSRFVAEHGEGKKTDSVTFSFSWQIVQADDTAAGVLDGPPHARAPGSSRARPGKRCGPAGTFRSADAPHTFDRVGLGLRRKLRLRSGQPDYEARLRSSASARAQSSCWCPWRWPPSIQY